MALASIIAVAAIVLIAGGLIAFLGHMIIGAFDNDRSSKPAKENELLDYNQYKQLENADNGTNGTRAEYDFEAINEAKAEEEQKLANNNEEEDIFKLLDEADDNVDPEEMENKLKNAEPVEENKETIEEASDDDFDIDNLIDEISDSVEEEVKAEQTDDVKMSDELESYSIDDILNQAEQEQAEETEEVVEEQPEAEQETEPVEETEEEASEPVKEVVVVKDDSEVEKLKAQIAELNKQLESKNNVNVVSIEMTEEQCEARLATLEERLKNAKREYKVNMKEYRPLRKMKNELERNQAKLRRKENAIAKQKLDLYGVNNYVDIDKEKAQKLTNEIEFYEGLRLSVEHCEEVINANKDRYPILEHTNNILEEQIANIEADIETTKIQLQKLRDKNGNGNK